MTKHSKKVLKTFFDFYLITALDTFCGEKTLNHANKARKISETCTDVVDRLYEMILDSLKYAVVREFRHYSSQVTIGNRKQKFITIASKIKRLFGLSKNAILDRSYEIQNRFIYQRRFLNWVKELKEIDFAELAQEFNNGHWYREYGGKKWGKAAELLTKLPQTHSEKVLWTDKVLDLYHNNGHLLNKSMVSVLSKPKTVGLYGDRRRNKTALNYRRYAQTLTELSAFSSVHVRNLFIANKLKLPKQII